ncbi:hypothetical protein P3T37_000741 [Kitasatospora sp. MAA4]|uniref:EndoU domain-containing protein n=1 Tax=Kitasatospora sp. MAA4 TaxID=3035093 RepID=UPI0024736A96|nr:EndoU domain-containing protein [Kitasatospora sp. MAA4]MDH6131372.1 hypothetical protein [Kitasatospora sp. MAA4]
MVSTAVFAGCEAATAGVGTVGCSALSGAAGGLVDQGFKCASAGGKAGSASSFRKSALEGGIAGAVGGGLGALGGKILGKAGPMALDAVGGLFGKGATEATDVAAEDATATATRDTVSEESSSAADGTCPVHSFTANTPVLMANNATKPISQIKIGDQITNSVPGKDGTETHTVTNVIITREHVLDGAINGRSQIAGWHLHPDQTGGTPENRFIDGTMSTNADGKVSVTGTVGARLPGGGRLAKNASAGHTFFPANWADTDVMAAGQELFDNGTYKRGGTMVTGTVRGVKMTRFLQKTADGTYTPSTFFPVGK